MPRTSPTIEERFNLILKEIISRLRPKGPVKLFCMKDNPGKKFTRRAPAAWPRTAPIIINARKNAKFDLSKSKHYSPKFLLNKHKFLKQSFVKFLFREI
jgi:hypothetical protein